jgi:hypothetical protein
VLVGNDGTAVEVLQPHRRSHSASSPRSPVLGELFFEDVHSWIGVFFQRPIGDPTSEQSGCPLILVVVERVSPAARQFEVYGVVGAPTPKSVGIFGRDDVVRRTHDLVQVADPGRVVSDALKWPHVQHRLRTPSQAGI